MDTIRILLGDPRHDTRGVHSSYIPVGLGYIAMFLTSQLKDYNFDIRISTQPDEIFDWIDDWKPHVIALSSYIWNSRLSYRMCEYGKEKVPSTLCVMGGPEFPSGTGQVNIDDTKNLCLAYMKERPKLDYYCFSDGEAGFIPLIQQFIRFELDSTKMRKANISIGGWVSVDDLSQNLLGGHPVSRVGLEDKVKGRDIIPSPYLTGILDHFLDGTYVPCWESARGCPFQCSFCDQGLDETKMVRFSVERICEELTYVAEKIAHLSGASSIRFHDSNWGMYKQDVDVSEHLLTLMEKHDWPKWIEISTPKNKKERILAIDERLKNRVQVALSQQSMNRNTLEEIKRNNYSNEEYLGFVEELKRRGKSPTCELIIPLPNETEETYHQSVRMLLDNMVGIGTYTLMMLQGAELGRSGARAKYKMKSGFRVIPRAFGEYRGKKVFDIEEVCIETNTMPYDSYLRCRRFSFLLVLFANPLFTPLKRLLMENDVEYYTFLLNVSKRLELAILNNCESGSFSKVYKEFSLESESEIFKSEQDIKDFYSDDASYDLLLSGDAGDNLLRKYLSMALLDVFPDLLECVKATLTDLKEESEELSVAGISSLIEWLKYSVAISVFSDFENRIDEKIDVISAYDVKDWIEHPGKKLVSCKKNTRFRFENNIEQLTKIRNELHDLFGDDDTAFAIGKYFFQFPNRKISDLSRNCSYLLDD